MKEERQFYLLGSSVSCHVIHSFVPPHCVPLRQVSASTGFFEPLIDLGAWAAPPLAASVFNTQQACLYW